MEFREAEFAKRLKKARNDRGYTQEKLAEKINMSKDFVTKMESGLGGCSLKTLVKITDVLQVDADYLLKGKRKNSPVTKEQLIKRMHECLDLVEKM